MKKVGSFVHHPSTVLNMHVNHCDSKKQYLKLAHFVELFFLKLSLLFRLVNNSKSYLAL